jgi:hypothetical protein
MGNGNGGQGIGNDKEVAVSVITPSGIFPSDDTLQRVPSDATISSVLRQAADKLELTNTTDWLVKSDGKDLDATRTFKHEHLKCIVDVVWQPREGGGGA